MYEQPIVAGKEPSATTEERDIANRRGDEVTSSATVFLWGIGLHRFSRAPMINVDAD